MGFMNILANPLFDIKAIRKCAICENGIVYGHFQSNILRSSFQPVFSLSHKRIVGYEALILVHDERTGPIPPNELFSQEREESDIVFLDRLCRFVHIGNFTRFPDDLNWLFLNVSPLVVGKGLNYGSFFNDLLNDYSFPSHRVVIEIVEHPIPDQTLLLDTVNYYKDIGCLVAIDDFGTGHSNFERIWSLSPHIVKLDRSMIIHAAQDKNIRRLFPSIVSLMHQAGALVLVEGIEDMDQTLIAMDSDVDFVQGYFFSRPITNLKNDQTINFDFNELFYKFKTLSTNEENHFELAYEKYRSYLLKVAVAIREGYPLHDACSLLLEDESIVRCYLLGIDGVQIEKTIILQKSLTKQNLQYKPLEDARSADWFRRNYLRQAILHPNQIQITKPYLSITGGHMCKTLSIMFSAPNGDRVLCFDLICNE